MIAIGSKVICSISIVCFHFVNQVSLPGDVKSIGDKKLYIEFEIDNRTCNDGNNYTLKKLVDKDECIEDNQ
jgi:hypothetical protein